MFTFIELDAVYFLQLYNWHKSSRCDVTLYGTVMRLGHYMASHIGHFVYRLQEFWWLHSEDIDGSRDPSKHQAYARFGWWWLLLVRLHEAAFWGFKRCDMVAGISRLRLPLCSIGAMFNIIGTSFITALVARKTCSILSKKSWKRCFVMLVCNSTSGRHHDVEVLNIVCLIHDIWRTCAGYESLLI